MSAPAGTAAIPRRAVLGSGAVLGTGLLVPKGFRLAVVGCQFHCAPMAPQRRNQVLFDWLAGAL